MTNNDQLAEALKIIAPGTPFRDGLDNILKARTGALIILGDSPEVLGIVEDGFDLDTDFRPAALYELAKMDGAIILSSDGGRILKANAHLVPQPSIPSLETGIRHRVAERVAKQTGALVIVISQRRNVITLYRGSLRYVLRDNAYVLTKANQAIQTLEKYKDLMEGTLNNLSLLEMEGQSRLPDVAQALARLEMVMHISREIEMHIAQLGVEGRLVEMQVTGVGARVDREEELIVKDYFQSPGDGTVKEITDLIRQSFREGDLDPLSVSKILGHGGTLTSLEQVVVPRGYRLLSKIPRLPASIMENLIDVFQKLPFIMEATLEDLDEVEGIGEVRARQIKKGIRQYREQIWLERQL
ncbi:MAG TPA: DNA integrity scanning protein DisA [Clostridia bacterium]|nr:DNA integrity scanning protein DisA [Clostridia bacterium]